MNSKANKITIEIRNTAPTAIPTEIPIVEVTEIVLSGMLTTGSEVLGDILCDEAVVLNSFV